MESQNNTDVEDPITEEERLPIMSLTFIARIIGIRAPESNEGHNTIIEFELHTEEGYRGKFNIPYNKDVGKLGTAYQANMFLKEIPLEDYIERRPETRQVVPKLEGHPLGLV